MGIAQNTVDKTSYGKNIQYLIYVLLKYNIRIINLRYKEETTLIPPYIESL